MCVRVHERGLAIIILRDFFRSTQIGVIKNIRVFPLKLPGFMHASKRSERANTPCNNY